MHDVNINVSHQYFTLILLKVSRLSFCFPLFLCIVMSDNEYNTKKIETEPRIKLNHNICMYVVTG